MATHSRPAFIAAVSVVALVSGSLAALNASASPGPDESTFVPVTPARVLDTRDPIDLGLDGPFVSAESQTLRITGTIPTTDGNRTVVPVGATGVVLNVTVVEPTAAGFVSIRPGDATGAPTTSSLNVEAGVVQPNAVTVALPLSGANAGTIDITYDAYGTPGPVTDLLIDVVGYTTNVGIQSLVDELATKADVADLDEKADAADVYTKAEVDAAIDDALAVEPFGTPPPDPFPTSMGTNVPSSFTTTRTSRLQITMSVAYSLSCTDSSQRFVWLTLNGEPLVSSLIRVSDRDADGGSVLPQIVLTGVTESPVPAGTHSVVARHACVTGAWDASATNLHVSGLVTYVGDRTAPSLAGVPIGGAVQVPWCEPPGAEVEPGTCVIEP